MKKFVIFGAKPGYRGVNCFVPNLTFEKAKTYEPGLTKKDYYSRIGAEMPKKKETKKEIKNLDLGDKSEHKNKYIKKED